MQEKLVGQAPVRVWACVLAVCMLAAVAVLGLSACTAGQASSTSEQTAEATTAARPDYQVEVPDDIQELVADDATEITSTDGTPMVGSVFVYEMHDNTVALEITMTSSNAEDIEVAAKQVAADLASHVTVTNASGAVITDSASGLGALYDVYDLKISCSDADRTYFLEGDKFFYQTDIDWE